MSIAELPEAVNEQRKRSWSVRWRKEVVVAQGESDVEVERIKELAKAEAQNEMYKHIREYRTEILNDNGDPDTKKMIAKKLVDGLHRLASDPTTHILLPGDTMRQIANLRHWVGLPDVDEERMLQLSEGSRRRTRRKIYRKLPQAAQRLKLSCRRLQPRLRPRRGEDRMKRISSKCRGAPLRSPHWAASWASARLAPTPVIEEIE